MTTYKYGSWCGAQATGKITQRAYLGYDLATNNDTTYTVNAFMGVQPWNTNWNAVTIDYSFAGTGYTTVSGQISGSTSSGSNIRCYPSSGTKSFSYTKGHSAVTKTITAKITLNHVDSTSGGSSVNGKTSTATYSFTVPAKTHYTVSYNANGGSGAPSSQTKWYNETLTLSSTKPTRTNYTFKGWSTSSSATSASYSAGSKYTANSGTTLYAVWAKIYVPATISSVSVYRTSDQTSTPVSSYKSDTGTYLYVKFNYVCGYYKGNTATAPSTTCTIKIDGTSKLTPSVSGSGTYTNESSRLSISGYGTTTSHTVAITLSNSVGTVTKNVVIPSVKYPIELYADGSKMALGIITRVKNDMHIDINEGTSGDADAMIISAISYMGWSSVYK